MFEIREDEPDYAYLNDPVTPESNRYGDAIDLTAASGQPTGASLNINGDTGVGTNPNRNKQHGFHFTADNCIGCHACEAACSEKNDLAPHLSFRSVGYVEGGTFPDFTRVNISMACNHCDDPVCLKGCPTGAYTKHAEYGAVLQDPDICFGCGYCTWVCPYNAPQLDPVAGNVQKCNMCVDRLEVGLKPACVSACLGNALDFGVIETTPENREQIKTQIPGFPHPEITHPNIRFQQTRSLPRDLTRTDSQPVKYQRTHEGYHPVVDEKDAAGGRWNLARLSSRENPLVVFTLTTQAIIGAFAVLFLGAAFGVDALAVLPSSGAYLAGVVALVAMQTAMLGLSTLHLGRPWRFYRGFNNLRHSPLSREALGISLFLGFMGGHALFTALGPYFPAAETLALISGWLAVTSGLAGLYFMVRIYRIKARPFWDHWQVTTTFFGTMVTLGALLAGLAFLPSAPALTGVLSALVFGGLAFEGAGLFAHACDLKAGGGEAAASHHRQTTLFGYTYGLRNVLMAANAGFALYLGTAGPDGGTGLVLWGLLSVSVIASALIGRALFHVLVIPTTMPGAFFWKNTAFEEHARKTGLADLPQVGVVPKNRL
jgi:DMSO reductase iron-sulfur subunit